MPTSLVCRYRKEPEAAGEVRSMPPGVRRSMEVTVLTAKKGAL
jgi:hypothetical protein